MGKEPLAYRMVQYIFLVPNSCLRSRSGRDQASQPGGCNCTSIKVELGYHPNLQLRPAHTNSQNLTGYNLQTSRPSRKPDVSCTIEGGYTIRSVSSLFFSFSCNHLLPGKQ